MNELKLQLRPVADSDMPFLLELYGTTRADELARVPWPDAEKEAFVHQQFNAQHRYWHEHYDNTSWDIIMLGAQPIGRLYVQRLADEIRVIDIALMPEHRGRGIGTRFFRDVFEEADRRGCKVSIHVEVFNPARRLYERLGFVLAEERGVYLLMERAATPRAQLHVVT